MHEAETRGCTGDRWRVGVAAESTDRVTGFLAVGSWKASQRLGGDRHSVVVGQGTRRARVKARADLEIYSHWIGPTRSDGGR